MSILEIDGIAIPIRAILGFDQEYDEIGQRSLRRTAANTAVLRTAGSGKLRTTISGRGWAPPGLAMLDAGATHVIGCAMPNGVVGASNTITIPAARRADPDHQPIGFALVGDEYVFTAISGIVANVATLAAVPGATGYVVHYWPEIVAVITRNTARGRSEAEFSWQIEAEEA